MKSLVFAPLIVFTGIASAQSSSSVTFSLKSPLEQYKAKQLASLTLDLSGPQISTPNSDSSVLKSRPLVLKNNALANLNFSKNDKIEYGLRLASEQFFDPFSFEKRLDAKLDYNQLSRLQAGAFINYHFAPDYNLTASVSRIAGFENGRIFSVGAKASKFFGRKHSVTGNLSFNWSNTRPNLWSQFDRSVTAANAFNANRFGTRPDLRLGVTWNWEINSNWSLSSGVSARHYLNEVNKNPFNTQRSTVTVFSVASYRF